MNERPIPPGNGSAAQDGARPLTGVRVLAIENFLAGPFASMWLADAGAEVVKIESPDSGDFARSTSPVRTADTGEAVGLSFLRSNRNKKSLTLDLKHAEGKELFRKLVREADVLVENMRPSVMERLGLGYDVLSKDNPRLVYVAISGFGHKDIAPSPYGDYPAFDIVGQALSGLMYRPERSNDMPTYLGFSLADIEAGILGAYGAMLALYQREQTGKGKKIDISLYDSCLILNEISIAMYSVFKQRSKPGLHAVTAPFGSYRATDGYLVIAVLGEHIWQRFCDVIGRPDLLQDPRFADGVLRQKNLDELNRSIDPWMSSRTKGEAVAILRAGGVPASVVQEVDELFTCPHVAARNMIVTLEDPVWGQVQVAGNPIKMSDVPEIDTKLPPRLGEHTADILRRWLKFDGTEIANLESQRVI
jgi:formyl-CoA transferase